MKKREASWQTIWNQYVRENKFYGYFELKQTTTNSIPFDDVKKHQMEGLISCQANGLCWKLSDADMREKPLDSFYSRPDNAYVVIKYPQAFCVINIFDFLKEKVVGDRKSLTFDRAKEISYKIVRC